jgi:hypothetical protein
MSRQIAERRAAESQSMQVLCFVDENIAATTRSVEAQSTHSRLAGSLALADSPLGTASCINLLIHLRGIFELAWTKQLPELAHLLRREDVPRLPQRLPRPLTAQQDHILQQELLRRNDLAANALLLIRHTGIALANAPISPAIVSVLQAHSNGRFTRGTSKGGFQCDWLSRFGRAI